MAPLLALLSILFGGEAEAAVAPVPKPAVAIVELAQSEEMESAEDSWKLSWAHDTQVAAQPEPASEQRWLGKVEVPGQVIDFVVTIVEGENGLTGKLDIPVQGLMGGELRTVVREGDELRFDFAIPNQPETVWPKWVVTIDESGKSAKGVLNQSGQSFPTAIVLDETGKAEVLRRPQHPTRPLPYREEEVVIDVGEHTLAGTLTLPSEAEFGEGPFPGAVLITGSGPQDRDETIVGHKPFLVLSDRLTRRGIAVLRYDERGVGASTGSFAGATSLDFADDARACVELLSRREEIGKIGLIGHSEGGMIAPIIAAGNEDVDFVVLLAAPGVSGAELLVRQARELGKASGVDAGLLDKQGAFQNAVHRLILDGKSKEQVQPVLRTLIETQLEASGVEADEQLLAQATEQAYAQFQDPWALGFMRLDPRPALAEMTQPVLALNGSLDLQVPPDQNLSEIRRVLLESGQADSTAYVIGGLNHLFQPTETGLPSEYSEIETTFDEDTMGMIVDWILEKMR